MAGFIVAGWDFARLGEHDLRLTDDGGTYTIDYTAGTYAHRDLQSVMGTGFYDDFAGKLAADMTARPGAGTYTVTWSAITLKYTLSYSAGNFSIDFTSTTFRQRMGQMLGFSANVSGASSYVSTRIPYYALALARDGVSNYSRPYETRGQTVRGVSVNASAYSIGPATYEKRISGKFRFMGLSAVHAETALSGTPWTYEHLLQHARCVEPVYIETTTTDLLVCKFVDSEFHEEARVPVWNDYHALWDVKFEVQRLGQLS